MNRLFLPDGYVENLYPSYFNDDEQIDWQPEVYRLAGMFAASRECTTIIDVGCGRARKSLRLPLRVVGIDRGPNLPEQMPDRDVWFIDHDLETGMPPALGLPEPGVRLEWCVVVCADVIEHLVDPLPLLSDLAAIAPHVQALLISTPDRDLVRGPDDLGPPANPCHVREWSKPEFLQLLASVGIGGELTHTIDNDRDRSRTTLLSVSLKAKP